MHTVSKLKPRWITICTAPESPVNHSSCALFFCSVHDLENAHLVRAKIHKSPQLMSHICGLFVSPAAALWHFGATYSRGYLESNNLSIQQCCFLFLSNICHILLRKTGESQLYQLEIMPLCTFNTGQSLRNNYCSCTCWQTAIALLGLFVIWSLTTT